MQVKVIRNIKWKGEYYSEGDVLDITERNLEVNSDLFKSLEESEEEVYECPHCDFTSTSKRGLAIHISAMHK